MSYERSVTSVVAVRTVGLATAAGVGDLDEDDTLLRGALAAEGLAARTEVWDDPRVDWASHALVVVRSTWDYAPRREKFLAWAASVASVTRLANPVGVLRWNTDKRYLRELAAAGLPVVPTAWVEPGDRPALPDAEEWVVKPAVSAGAKDTARYPADRRDAALAHVARLQRRGRTAMVQPYLAGVDVAGETAVVHIGGAYSHTVRKGPLLRVGAEPVAGLFAEEEIAAREPAPAERALAADVLAHALPLARREAAGGVEAGVGDLLYARVDLVPGPDGDPVLLELELAEPSLFLAHAPGAAERFAGAIAAAVARVDRSA